MKCPVCGGRKTISNPTCPTDSRHCRDCGTALYKLQPKREAWLGFLEEGKRVWVGPFPDWQTVNTYALPDGTRPADATILGPSKSLQWMRDWIAPDEVRAP